MKILVMTCLAGVLAIPAVISAGEKWKADVVINQNVPYANGGMGAARNSKDSNQNIGCYVSTNGPGHTAGYCWRGTPRDRPCCKWFDDLILERMVSAMTSTAPCERLPRVREEPIDVAATGAVRLSVTTR
jgi:hypothetical protein